MDLLKRVAKILVTVVLFVSCDTREDYFYEHGEAPTVEVKESVSTDEVGENTTGRQFVKTTLHWGDTSIVSLEIQDPYGKPYSMSFEIDHVSVENCLTEYPYVLIEESTDVSEKDLFKLTELLEITYDNHERQVMIVDKVESAMQFYEAYQKMFPNGFWNSERSVKDMTITCVVNIKNMIGVSTPFYLHINLKGNNSPLPEILVEDGLTYMEKYIRVNETCDPDGDKIVCYEYLIDGQSLGKKGYEFEEEYPAPSAGRGGYDGTYITTRRSGVNHAFQSTGEHTVAVRCQDEWGFWSDWVKKEIIIDYKKE